MIENDHVVLWNRCLNIIRDNVPDTTYKTWFEPIVPLKYEDHALTIGVPSPFFYEFLEEKFVDLLRAIRLPTRCRLRLRRIWIRI